MQHLSVLGEGSPGSKMHPVLVASCQPLTDETFREALASNDGIIRLEIMSTVEHFWIPEHDAPSEQLDPCDSHMGDSGNASPVFDPKDECVHGTVVHNSSLVTADPPMPPQQPQPPQQPMPLIPLPEGLQQLQQRVCESLPQLHQNLHQNLHQLHQRAHEHIQQQLSLAGLQHEQMQRRLHEQLHQAHCHMMQQQQQWQQRLASMQQHHADIRAQGINGTHQRPEPQNQAAHWADTLNVQTEVSPMYVQPLEMREQRRHIARGMITGSLRLFDSDLLLDNCMVTGSLHLLGSSRVLLRGGMLTGSVTRSSTSTFENSGGMHTGQVVQMH